MKKPCACIIVFASLYCSSLVFWSSLDAFLAYSFTTGRVRGYAIQRLAPVICKKVNDGLVVSVFTSAVDANWLSSLIDMTISDIVPHDRRYYIAIDENVGF